jgi:hypothetical protein
MIVEILAYISVGIIVIGWLLTIIFDLVGKIQNNSKKDEIIGEKVKNG